MPEYLMTTVNNKLYRTFKTQQDFNKKAPDHSKPFYKVK